MKQAVQDVSLLYHTPDPEFNVAQAAWTCYHQDMDDFVAGVTHEEIIKFVRMLARVGHLSTYEHVSFTFRLRGVSRALTHQLVRHRIASYNQQSQRYCTYAGVDIAFVWPETIQNNVDARVAYEYALLKAVETYDVLIAKGIPAEDARYILPNATPSEIIVTMNARELHSFFAERQCARAQWEIRDAANKMFELVNEVAPALFESAGPSCVKGACKQGKMSCGKPIRR